MEEKRISCIQKSLLVLTALMVFSMFSAVSAHAAASTASAAYNTYKTVLGGQNSNYDSFGIAYLNNDSIPDLVAVTTDNSGQCLRYALYINGERCYGNGLTNATINSELGTSIFYYPKRGFFYNAWRGANYWFGLKKIGSAYDFFYLFDNKYRKDSNGKFFNYWYYKWVSTENNPYDRLRGKSYICYGKEAQDFNSLMQSYRGSVSPQKVTLYANNSANRNKYLKAATKKSQTISTPKTSYYATYKKNGTFSLNASAKTTLSYSSANKSIATVSSTGKVTIKGYGVVAITIKAKATTTYKSASKTVYVYVKPVKMKITSLKKGGTGKFVIEWTKDTKVTGYQIQYSLSSSFSSPVTVTSSSYKYDRATINTKAKGTKLYVRIRAYKTMNGKTAYGPWSAVKTVTTGK